jgi:hypothetical protein
MIDCVAFLERASSRLCSLAQLADMQTTSQLGPTVDESGANVRCSSHYELLHSAAFAHAASLTELPVRCSDEQRREALGPTIDAMRLFNEVSCHVVLIMMSLRGLCHVPCTVSSVSFVHLCCALTLGLLRVFAVLQLGMGSVAVAEPPECPAPRSRLRAWTDEEERAYEAGVLTFGQGPVCTCRRAVCATRVIVGRGACDAVGCCVALRCCQA